MITLSTLNALEASLERPRSAFDHQTQYEGYRSGLMALVGALREILGEVGNPATGDLVSREAAIAWLERAKADVAALAEEAPFGQTVIFKAEDLSGFCDEVADAIRALPAVPAVKGLKWESDHERYFEAKSIIGIYNAIKSPAVDYWLLAPPMGDRSRHDTLEAAKAAAQADYDARILATLEGGEA